MNSAPTSLTPVHRARIRFAAGVRSGILLAADLAGDPFARLQRLRPGADRRPLHARVRSSGPVSQSRLGVMLSADHAVASAVLRSPSSSSAMQELPGLLGRIVGPLEDISPTPHPVSESMVVCDAPDHTRLRRLVSRGFTPRRLEAHRSRIRAVAEELLDQMPTDRPTDLVDGFARQLPMQVICDVMGVPSHERGRFTAWGDALAATLGGIETFAQHEAVPRAAADIEQFFEELVAQRRANPGDDLVSALVARAEDADSDALGHRELLVTLAFLLIAGFETTVNLLGRGTEALLADPAQQRAVVDDLSLVPGLVEEALRFVSPVRYTYRRVTQPLLVESGRGAILVPAGTEIVCLLDAANRDPLVYDEPDRFDITRANAREHLAFSQGALTCLGASLARMEAEEAWRALLGRHPEMRGAGTPTPTASNLINGLSSLPVVLGRRAADRV